MSVPPRQFRDWLTGRSTVRCSGRGRRGYRQYRKRQEQSLSASFNPEEALDVSEDAILALFGQNRTAGFRMAGLPLQKECEKD